MLEIKTAMALGELVVKLGMTGYKAWLKTRAENADPITLEEIETLLSDHMTTDEILAGLGVDASELDNA